MMEVAVPYPALHALAYCRPDTQTYIRRLEQEKAERARGENADNRSFFAKYVSSF